MPYRRNDESITVDMDSHAHGQQGRVLYKEATKLQKHDSEGGDSWVQDSVTHQLAKAFLVKTFNLVARTLSRRRWAFRDDPWKVREEYRIENPPLARVVGHLYCPLRLPNFSFADYWDTCCIGPLEKTDSMLRAQTSTSIVWKKILNVHWLEHDWVWWKIIRRYGRYGRSRYKRLTLTESAKRKLSVIDFAAPSGVILRDVKRLRKDTTPGIHPCVK